LATVTIFSPFVVQFVTPPTAGMPTGALGASGRTVANCTNGVIWQPPAMLLILTDERTASMAMHGMKPVNQKYWYCVVLVPMTVMVTSGSSLTSCMSLISVCGWK